MNIIHLYSQRTFIFHHNRLSFATALRQKSSWQLHFRLPAHNACQLHFALHPQPPATSGVAMAVIAHLEP
jgi:hypothetical protein